MVDDAAPRPWRRCPSREGHPENPWGADPRRDPRHPPSGASADAPSAVADGRTSPPSGPHCPEPAGRPHRALASRLSAARLARREAACDREFARDQLKEAHMDSVLIRNGRIVTATDDYRADILVEDGRVRMI